MLYKLRHFMSNSVKCPLHAGDSYEWLSNTRSVPNVTLTRDLFPLDTLFTCVLFEWSLCNLASFRAN